MSLFFLGASQLQLAPLPGSGDLAMIWPVVIVALAFLLLMVEDALFSRPSASMAGYITALTGVFLAILATLWEWFYNTPKVFGFGEGVAYDLSLAGDHLGQFFGLIILVTALVSILLSRGYLGRRRLSAPEYYALMLAATAGMQLLAGALDLIVIFLGIELLSISLYVLSAYGRDDTRSQEAGLKYLILGGMASAVLLYGMALVFGSTGHTVLPLIHATLAYAASQGQAPGTLLIAGMALILVGFAFKISAAPFHVWTPDVYQGAPMSVTMFMSVATKVAAFAALIRLFEVTFGGIATYWYPLMAGVAIMSMLWGNIAALTQSSIKRMLAYSGIAQAGYMLIGVAVATQQSVTAVLFYLAAYAVTNLGAFAVLTAMSNGTEDIDSYDGIRGLAYRRPYVAVALCIFMLSLAGFPPTVGFLGKFLVFQAAVGSPHLWLAIYGAVMSAVALVYYLRVAILVFMPAADGVEVDWPQTGLVAGGVLSVAAVATLVLGMIGTLLLDPAAIAANGNAIVGFVAHLL